MTQSHPQQSEAVAAALAVMDAHIEGLNARDPAAIAATLHFPHIRLSGTKLKVWETEESYFSDFLSRAGDDWDHSRFDDIQLLRASENKVHLDAEIRRFNFSGEMIAKFRSLWVITFEDGRWAAKMRSSFAKA